MAQAAVLSRRERKKLEVRGRLLDAARALFDARGFGATTVAEICEGADVAQKTFFNYFPTKQHLLRALAEQDLARLLDLVDEARRRERSTTGRLESLFARIAQEVERAGPMHRELLTEMIHVAHESRSEPEQARLLHDAFARVVRDGRASGDVGTDASVDTQSELVLGAFYALMFGWAHRDGYRLRGRAQALARLLGEALARGTDR